jgi:hypothetical protein
MKNKVGKMIIYDNVIYNYEKNQSAFHRYQSDLHENKISSVLLFPTRKSTSIIKVWSSECLFIFDGDEEKYPEYFI